MNCSDVEKWLSAYMDGELIPARKDAVASHLGSCEACRSRLAEWKAVWQALDALPAAAPSPAFRSRLAARIRESERPPVSERFERFLIPVSAAAVALLGFWIGYIAGGRQASSAGIPDSVSPIASTAYLDSFNSVPTASLGDIYLSLNDAIGSEETP
ncbi:zf-HC2 domain-containing protein [bacterium]|nr:zf-HC2 domain-containing protein [bacterium]